MEVHLDSEESTTSGNKETGKQRRPAGRMASSPAEVADQTGRLLVEREPEWLGRLTSDPASFAAIELEVHEQTRRRHSPAFRNTNCGRFVGVPFEAKYRCLCYYKFVWSRPPGARVGFFSN